jgi:shikimate kinase
MRIYLLGFMGSGKSTVGRKLASSLGIKYIDLDRQIELATSLYIPAIFQQLGEEQFRVWEREELQKTIHMKDVVVSTGGGTPCFFDNIELMNQSGITVYLEMTPAELASRLIRAKKQRPLLRKTPPDQLESKVSELLEVRVSYYQRAQIIMNGFNPDINSLIDNITLMSEHQKNEDNLLLSSE